MVEKTYRWESKNVESLVCEKMGGRGRKRRRKSGNLDSNF